MKSINSKFKGEIPDQKPVAVEQVNATAQRDPMRKKSPKERPAAKAVRAKLKEEDYDKDSRLPSPPASGMPRFSDRTSPPLHNPSPLLQARDPQLAQAEQFY